MSKDQQIKDFLYDCLTDEQRLSLFDLLFNEKSTVNTPVIFSNIEENKNQSIENRILRGYDAVKVSIVFEYGMCAIGIPSPENEK